VTFLLAHLSDAHIGPLPKPLRRELLNKRLTGYMNWLRRSQIHDMKVLTAIVEDMKAQAPDHIAMTGDVMNIGLPAEFPIAKTWLETLGPSQDVSFTPGNHDAYVRASVPWIARTFGPWCANDGDEIARFPYLRVRGEIALIGLSSGVPTAPLLASGRLGLEQREKLANLLEETGRRGLMRVVMIHHPPTRKGASAGRGLSDSRHFESIIREKGAELVLHGHNHRLQVRHIEHEGRRIPVVGVPSASAVPGTPAHRAAYHLYRIEKRDNHWSIEARMRGTSAGTDHVMDLGPITL
jgi:3',5'-cyclic AMP phosphodiesterase CpdA